MYVIAEVTRMQCLHAPDQLLCVYYILRGQGHCLLFGKFISPVNCYCVIHSLAMMCSLPCNDDGALWLTHTTTVLLLHADK